MTRTRLTMVEGDTWQWLVQVRDEAGDPWDFTGLEAVLQLRRTPTGEALAELTEGDGLTLDSPDPGDISIAVPSDITAGTAGGRVATSYVYADLELRSSADPPVVTTLAQFEIAVDWEATQNV